MSLRLEMLQVARLAPKLLGESTELVRAFLLGQQNPDGGFRDRNDRSDLYYTVFGLDALLALEVQSSKFKVQRGDLAERFAKTAKYVAGFGSGEGLDYVHLCCLARARAAVGAANQVPSNNIERHILRRLGNFRSQDGGYNPAAGAEFGTAYAGFLALGAHQDLKAELPEPLRLVQSFKFLETSDGAWTNERHSQSASRKPQAAVGSTNATAAAITLLRNLGQPLNPAIGDWLLARCHPQGGFLAVPAAPMPDLLSTATALHALSGMQVDFSAIKESCLDFVDSLWTNEGAFHGSWGDETLDCEYTFYGLLALGHLSL
ncbi:MAG: hypothetical protein FJ398_08475 [Verrucomicrobia bacterium]|nr:hypothetical protein [Verrucomicrobiota bacterium]